MTTQTSLPRMPRALHDRLVLGMWPRTIGSDMAVPLAATQARFLTERERSYESIGCLVAQRDELFGKMQEALPVEETLIETLKRRHQGVCRELDIRQLTLTMDFPTLNPEFLQWKNGSGYPAFSIYNVNSPQCRIHLDRSVRIPLENGDSVRLNLPGLPGRTITVEPSLPPILAEHFVDELLVNVLEQECTEHTLQSIELVSRYDGLMPDAVREHIRAKRHLFDNVFIIANAPRWQRNTVTAIYPGDPLVVGIKRNIVWLMATYDLAPLEKLAVDMSVQGEAGTFRIFN